MIPVIFWFTQDFLAVLTSNAMRIPEIFLSSLVYCLLTKGRDAYISVVWSAFIGGLVWDLRWIRPGSLAVVYVSAVMVVLWGWSALPSSGRTPAVVFFLFWLAQLFPAILYIFLLERNAEGVNWALLGAQQGCAVPLSLLWTFFYLQYEKGQNA